MLHKHTALLSRKEMHFYIFVHKVVVLNSFPVRCTELATRDVSVEKPERSRNSFNPDSLDEKLSSMYFAASHCSLQEVSRCLNGKQAGLWNGRWPTFLHPLILYKIKNILRLVSSETILALTWTLWLWIINDIQEFSSEQQDILEKKGSLFESNPSSALTVCRRIQGQQPQQPVQLNTVCNYCKRVKDVLIDNNSNPHLFTSSTLYNSTT